MASTHGFICGLAFYLVACATPSVPTDAWTEFDSGGVHVVVSHRPAQQPADWWSVNPEPTLSLGGGQETSSQFFCIVGAFINGQGNLVVGNRGSQEVRFYTSTGEHIRSSGGEGDGPGEYTRLESVYPYRADSVLALDTRRWLITVLAPDGTFGRHIALDIRALGGRITLLGADDAGRILLRLGSGLGGAAVGAVVRHTESVIRMEPEGTQITELATIRGPESIEVDAGSWGLITSYRPFGRNTLVRTSGSSIITHSNDTFQLEIRDANSTRILRLDRDATEITEVDIDVAARRRAEEDLAGYEAQDLVDALFDPQVLPRTLPAWHEILTDRDGYIWAAVTPSPSSDERIWDVFSRDGYLLGSVLVPARLTITDITRNRIVALWRDEFNVEYIRLYALERSGD